MEKNKQRPDSAHTARPFFLLARMHGQRSSGERGVRNDSAR